MLMMLSLMTLYMTCWMPISIWCARHYTWIIWQVWWRAIRRPMRIPAIRHVIVWVSSENKARSSVFRSVQIAFKRFTIIWNIIWLVGLLWICSSATSKLHICHRRFDTSTRARTFTGPALQECRVKRHLNEPRAAEKVFHPLQVDSAIDLDIGAHSESPAGTDGRILRDSVYPQNDTGHLIVWYSAREVANNKTE